MRTIATYGDPSTVRAISAWPFDSSKGTTTYETQLHADGILTCNCPGWCSHLDKKTGKRSCRHVKEKVYEAQQILDGKRQPIFARQDGKHSHPQVIIKEVIKEVPKIVERVVEKVVVKEVQMMSPSTTIRTGRRLLRAEKEE